MNCFGAITIVSLVLLSEISTASSPAKLANIAATVPSSKILVVSFFSSQSHKNVFEPLVYNLADRNHSITIFSPFKNNKAHKNIRDIIGYPSEKIQQWYTEKFNLFDMRQNKMTQNFSPKTFLPLLETICKHNYEMPEMKSLLREKFDLIMTSIFMNECIYGLIHHFQAPFILLNPFSAPPSLTGLTGTPSPISFVPNPMLLYSDSMNFMERSVNMYTNIYHQLMQEWTYIPKHEEIYRQYFGQETPSIATISKNVSVILSNAHFSLSYAKPLMPDVIEVAGLHCRSAKPLPNDIEEFIVGAGKEGTIYFSFGSVIKASQMSPKFRDMFLKAFSRLKQRVIWKWEEPMPENVVVPINVMIRSWLPQQDILGHPNVKLFITHGGLLSTEEALFHGVPLLGIPIFADQDWNIRQAVIKGFAVLAEFRELSEKKLVSLISNTLNNPKYEKRAKELSAIFTQRPQNPLDTATFWVEYVLLHKGASHLRSPARKLNFVQYYGIDVIGAFLFTISVILLITFYILKQLSSNCLVMLMKSKEKKA